MKHVRDPLVRWISDSWIADPGESSAGPTFSVLRVPFDHAVSFRPGARFGPGSILGALNDLSLYCPDKGICLDDVRFLDAGEVEVFHSLRASYAAIEEATAGIASSTQPVLLGGDHSITDPVVRGLRRRAGGQPFGLVVFDAHFDSRAPVEGQEHSGHWLNTLADVIDYGTVAQLGIGAAIYSRRYMDAARDSGVLVRTPYEIRRRGWPETIAEVIDHVTRDTNGVYVSVDIDCLDMAFAPGTSCPSPAGLFPHEVMDAVFEISRDAPVVGLDVVEVSPPLDRLDETSQRAAAIVLNHVAGVAARSGVPA